MTLEEYLKEVKERCSKATEGPWWSDGTSYVWKEQIMISDTPEDGSITRARGTGSGLTCEEQSNNIEFIAHARQDVPALLEMVVRMHNYIKASNQMYPNEKDLENFESLIPTQEEK